MARRRSVWLVVARSMLLVVAAWFGPGWSNAWATSAQPDWSHLTVMQKQALAPLESEWPRFDANRKRKWLDIAARYPAMSPAQRNVLHRRMAEWIKMTPLQRRLARENYLATGRASLQKRKQAWTHYQQLPEAKKHELAREAKAPPAAPGHVGQYGAGAKHHKPSPRKPTVSAAPSPVPNVSAAIPAAPAAPAPVASKAGMNAANIPIPAPGSAPVHP